MTPAIARRMARRSAEIRLPRGPYGDSGHPCLLYSVPHWGVAAPRNVRTCVPGASHMPSRGRLSTDLAVMAMAAAASGPGETDDPHTPQQGLACRGSSLVHGR